MHTINLNKKKDIHEEQGDRNMADTPDDNTGDTEKSSEGNTRTRTHTHTIYIYIYIYI